MDRIDHGSGLAPVPRLPGDARREHDGAAPHPDASQRMLTNRIRNRQKHLARWARRTGITCYRLYERDIPDWPLIVDWYDGEAVAWAYRRKKDGTEEAHAAYLLAAREAIAAGLETTADAVILKERRPQKHVEGAQYERMAALNRTRVVMEYGLRFEVNLHDYLDTGLFLDHRETRRMVRERSAGRRLLNLFAYTGSFTVYARAGGAAATTTVDLSATYCRWAARNAGLNGFEPDPDHAIIQEDCLRFIEDATRARRTWDLIVCDPPTFSTSKRMTADSFAVERDHADLLRGCISLLAGGGELFFSTNARGFALADDAVPAPCTMRDITRQTTPEDFQGRPRPPHRCWSIRRPAGTTGKGHASAPGDMVDR